MAMTTDTRTSRLHQEIQNRLGNWAVIYRLQEGHGVYGDLITVTLRLTPGAMVSLQQETKD